MKLSPGFLMSTDAECLSVARDPSGRLDASAVLRTLVNEVGSIVPSLPGPSGLFTGHGRVYVDSGHLELAAAECGSPYEVPIMLEKLQTIAAEAAKRLVARGLDVTLGTGTHNGRLGPGSASWGAHENYLVGTAPEGLVDRALPFLVTRAFAGSGAVWSPTGELLAGARLSSLSLDRGGGTVDRRAIFSTARQEHLAGGRPHHYRCHLILGDGHRSQFGLALQLGTTALVLRALEAFPDRVHPLPRLPGSDEGRFWIEALQSFNRLSWAPQAPEVHPVALDVQRFYWRLASDFVAGLDEPGPWTARLLGDWNDVLGALERGDDEWLSTRLDPWIKRRLFLASLRDRGAGPGDLRTRPDLVDRLALLDGDYHVFTGDGPLFDRLEAVGLLEHRVAPFVAPGDEPEPFVPDVATRARVRARLVRDAAPRDGWVVDWDGARHDALNRRLALADPFATSWGPVGPPQ